MINNYLTARVTSVTNEVTTEASRRRIRKSDQPDVQYTCFVPCTFAKSAISPSTQKRPPNPKGRSAGERNPGPVGVVVVRPVAGVADHQLHVRTPGDVDI